MIERLAIFGATGDLTARYLLPGLAALAHAGQLSESFELVGADRRAWHDDDFRQWVGAQLDQHAPQLPSGARQWLVARTRYRQADVTDPASVKAAVQGAGPIAAYLALPPSVFAPAVEALHHGDLAPGSTVVLEKPFGESLEAAVDLNRLLTDLVPEDAVFRVDHFLAMMTVQNLLGTRIANRLFEPVWNSTHIAEIDILWEESLGLEGRLLRRRRCVEGHAAEPPSADHVPRRYGTADQPRSPRSA